MLLDFQSNQQNMKTLPKAEFSFFEKLRNSLKDHQSYIEIMKCFYCYVEGVLNQYEFFELTSPYFDRNNEELLITLKTMISNRDNARRHQNLLCKPLSEFDTSQFKKISYSYYEINTKFPKPICGGRSNKEFKALYD